MSNTYSTGKSNPSSASFQDPDLLFFFPRMHLSFLSGGSPTGSSTGSLLELRHYIEFNKSQNDDDHYLQLRYPSAGIEIVLTAKTLVVRESTGSYVIPDWDFRIQFPQEFVGSWNSPLPQDLHEQLGKDFKTWQTVEEHLMVIFAAYTKFPENFHPSEVKGSVSGYPSEKTGDYAGGQVAVLGPPFPQYDPSSSYPDDKGGRLVLVDEENGSEIGEMAGYQFQSIGVHPGSKDPVEVVLPQNGEGPVTVRPAEYLRDAMHPSYAKSSIVSTAVTASRLIVTTSSYIANAINSGAEAYTKRTKPNETPMTFDPSTHSRVRQIHTFSTSAAKISSQTIGQVTKHAQNLGARFVGKNQDRPSRGEIPNPGLLNKSLIAFSTIADGIDHASRSLLGSGANAATTIVGHKYGDEARSVAYGLTGSVKNVGLVYVDASGVSRRAIIKGVAKGMVIGKVRGGGEVMIPTDQYAIEGPMNGPYTGSSSMPGSGKTTPSAFGNQVGFGNGAPPSYGSVQGTPGPSGYIQDSNPYFAPPPRSATAPQSTGYASMRSISPRPYEPAAYQSYSSHPPPPPPPPPEKGPSSNQQEYRYL